VDEEVALGARQLLGYERVQSEVEEEAVEALARDGLG